MLLRFNYVAHVQIQRGGGGGQRVRVPLKSHKNIGFLSNTGPDFFSMEMLIRQYECKQIFTNVLESLRMLCHQSE